mgnify:FL=1
MIIIETISFKNIEDYPSNYNTNNHYEKKPDNYDEYISLFDTKYWIDKIHSYQKITIQKKDISWLYECLEYGNLYRKFLSNYLEELDDLIYQYPQLKKDNYFVRTDKTSLKSGIYGIGPYTNLKDIIISMTTTRFGHHAFNKTDSEINLYLLKYKKIDMDKEFRVFVVDNKISLISQQNIYKKNNYLPTINIEDFINHLDDYFNQSIKNKLLDYKNYIMDIVYLEDTHEFYFIEINPFGKEYTSGSGCFHWINDNDIIYDTNNITFRYVN